MKTLNPTLWAVIFTLLPFFAAAQTAVPFSSDQWQFSNQDYVLEEYLGRPGVLLKNSRASLKDVKFTDGIIEYDVAFPPGRGFIGVSFRVQDDKNFENFYLRTHQSGNPDANQYMPMFNGRESWQLYHGEGYGAPVKYQYDQWMHVKLVVADRQMEVYIDDMNTPAVFVPELKRPVQPGTLAINGGARFANFSYTLLEKPALKSTATPAPPAPAGTITHWQVSSPFSEQRLDAAYQLPPALKNGLKWQTLPAEATGLVNLAVGPQWTKTENTTFARLVLVSDKAQVKQLQLGFSDRVRVYLNDQMLYSGHDEFQSRDYRFLGTVGYWDEVYLPLKKGRNELWIAVSEDFGGWGIKGAIADRGGLTVERNGLTGLQTTPPADRK